MRSKSSIQGLSTGLLAYSIWGFFPLFFHFLKDVSPLEVLTQRIIWSFIFVIALIIILKRFKFVILAFRQKPIIVGLLLSSVLVSLNWLIFIWAIGQSRALEASLGYFITPLVSVFLARVFLKEQLDTWRIASIVLASLGILWILYAIGSLPWVSLSLAATFGLYGLVRKHVDVDTITGLSIETFILLPLALMYWLWLDVNSLGIMFRGDSYLTTLLMISGVVTALPLLLFSYAAKKMTLTAIGFLMYINPTLQFFIATQILNEPLNNDVLISFYFIWAALIVFSIGSIKAKQHDK